MTSHKLDVYLLISAPALIMASYSNKESLTIKHVNNGKFFYRNSFGLEIFHNATPC